MHLSRLLRTLDAVPVPETWTVRHYEDGYYTEKCHGCSTTWKDIDTDYAWDTIRNHDGECPGRVR